MFEVVLLLMSGTCSQTLGITSAMTGALIYLLLLVVALSTIFRLELLNPGRSKL